MTVVAKEQDRFERRLAEIRSEQQETASSNNLWLSHHWPTDQDERCVTVAGRQVCRRCLTLHPLAIVIAVAFVFGFRIWPASLDPVVIWALSTPATIAFVGEALGWFNYSSRWQVATTALAALAFGRALGYELENRWHPYFWGPIAVFGGVWFFASWYGHWGRGRGSING